MVSGASSGIGLATAQRIHDLGAEVTALARRREAMEEGLGDRDVDIRAVDVGDREAVAAALDHDVARRARARGRDEREGPQLLATSRPRAGSR